MQVRTGKAPSQKGAARCLCCQLLWMNRKKYTSGKMQKHYLQQSPKRMKRTRSKLNEDTHLDETILLRPLKAISFYTEIQNQSQSEKL